MVMFQAIQRWPSVHYGPVVATMDEARDYLLDRTGNMSAGHIRELYGPGMIAHAQEVAGREY